MQLCRQGGSPATALQRWLQAFRTHLTEEAAADVESAIALLRLGLGHRYPPCRPHLQVLSVPFPPGTLLRL
eukprot:2765170-Amphidinium_carterae.1